MRPSQRPAGHTATILLALAAVWFCGGVNAGRAEEITLYSTREANLLVPVITAFTAASGITVKPVPTAFKGGGSHVNLTGAALAKHAPHPAAARRFLEFLVTPAAQRIYAAAELEYPVIAAADRDPIVREIGSFPADPLPVDQIAARQQAAIGLIKKVGFDD